MSTQEQREFGRQKYHGTVGKKKKPTNGKLVIVWSNNKTEDLLVDKPFPLLNAERMRLIRNGDFFARQLKVKYL